MQCTARKRRKIGQCLTIIVALVLLATKLTVDLVLHYKVQQQQQQLLLQQQLPQTHQQRSNESKQERRPVASAFHPNNLGHPTGNVKQTAPQQGSKASQALTKRENSSHSSNNGKIPARRFAYAMVIGGCNPKDGRYNGFLYNLLVARQLLNDFGSSADMIVFFQMSYNYTTISTTSTTTGSSDHQHQLPMEQVRALKQMNIQIQYLPKSTLDTEDSFYETVMNKFIILNLTSYHRVMLLDADVMPLANLDFLFHFSSKENVIVSGAIEPANGGLFVLSPAPGHYQRLQEIIRRRAVASVEGQLEQPLSITINSTTPIGAFDPVRGWGHVIVPPDQWKARRPGQFGTNWTFHFAFSDQGLLYHWTKYDRKSVSIIFENYVEHWGANDTDMDKEASDRPVVLQQRVEDPFVNFSKPEQIDSPYRPRIRVYAACKKFLCHVKHFTGSQKPWLRRPIKGYINASLQFSDPTLLWWHTLYRIDQRLQMNLDFDHWKMWQEAPLGGYATLADMEKHARLQIEQQHPR